MNHWITKSKHKMIRRKQTVGWREWASLPEMGIPAIKIKIDTGAKTSALHAFDLETFTQDGKDQVRFNIHPLQRNDTLIKSYTAPIVSEKTVKSSNGQKERRITIRTPIVIGDKQWDIDITLTNRDIMNYRMLLGRGAMGKLIVEPAKSFCRGRLSKEEVERLYQG